MDPAEIRRALLQRFIRPILPVLSLLAIPFVTALLRADLATLPLTGVIACVIIPVLFGVRAVLKFFAGDASGYLPADLLKGPVLSGPFAVPSGDPFLHDPLYQARSGYLYLVQHDVKRMVSDLNNHGYQLVVFLDDLDRCPPDTVAEVFEAVNIFLADDFSTAKFVVGLDPNVVTRRLAEAFRPEESSLWHYPDDPNPGWSFVRKLCQLTVTLPEIREAHTARLMRQHTPGDPAQAAGEASSSRAPQAHEHDTRPHENRRRAQDSQLDAGGQSPASGTSPTNGPTDNSTAADAAPSTSSPSRELPLDANAQRQADSRREGVASTDADKLLFEGDPVVRDHLRMLITLRPHQSVRETKRLLTLWGFYIRLLRRLLPEDATASTHFGRDVLTLAEILTRWPALVPALGSVPGVESGLRELIKAATTDSPHDLAWQRATRQLGLDGVEYRNATANLRELLARHGNDEVAYYAETVL